MAQGNPVILTFQVSNVKIKNRLFAYDSIFSGVFHLLQSAFHSCATKTVTLVNSFSSFTSNYV